MKIRGYIIPHLESILDESISSEKELMALLMYDPNNDLVRGIVVPEYLKKKGIINHTDKECIIDDSVLSNIQKFNAGDLKEFYIGEIKIGDKKLWFDFNGLKVIPYHTHPLEGQDIFPSKDYMDETKKWNAPAVIIASKDAKDKFRMKPPFTAGYVSEERNYTGRNEEKMLPYEKVLVMGEHTSSCLISANFEKAP